MSYLGPDGKIYDHKVSGAIFLGGQDNAAPQAQKNVTPAFVNLNNSYRVSLPDDDEDSNEVLRAVLYWIITVIFSVGIGVGLYTFFGQNLFENPPENASEKFKEIFYLLSDFVMYLIPAGSLACTVWYGIEEAQYEDYNIVTYFIAIVAAVCGALLMGVAIFALSGLVGFIWTVMEIAMTILKWILIIGIVLAVIAIFSGV